MLNDDCKYLLFRTIEEELEVQEIDVREVKQFAEGNDSEDRNGEADRQACS